MYVRTYVHIYTNTHKYTPEEIGSVIDEKL